MIRGNLIIFEAKIVRETEGINVGLLALRSREGQTKIIKDRLILNGEMK